MVPIRLILVIAIILFIVAMWYVFTPSKKPLQQKQDLFDEIDSLKNKLHDAEEEALNGEEESRKKAEEYKNRLDKLNKLKNKLN